MGKHIRRGCIVCTPFQPTLIHSPPTPCHIPLHVRLLIRRCTASHCNAFATPRNGSPWACIGLRPTCRGRLGGEPQLQQRSASEHRHVWSQASNATGSGRMGSMSCHRGPLRREGERGGRCADDQAGPTCSHCWTVARGLAGCWLRRVFRFNSNPRPQQSAISKRIDAQKHKKRKQKKTHNTPRLSVGVGVAISRVVLNCPCDSCTLAFGFSASAAVFRCLRPKRFAESAPGPSVQRPTPFPHTRVRACAQTLHRVRTRSPPLLPRGSLGTPDLWLG